MQRLALLLIVLPVLILAGCSGGDKTPVTQGTGTITGQLAGASPENYNIVVDGAELDAHPAPDGSFSIPNLPAGTHYVSLISDSGFAGAHMAVPVNSGDETDIGDVTPQPGGQIVGLVSQKDGEGHLTPLSGVTVIADPEPVYVMDGEEPGEQPAEETGDLSIRAVTDSNGSYIMPAVPEGAYVVTVNVPGLVQGVCYVWVTAGTTSPADFQLLEAIDEGVGTVNGTVFAVDGDSEAPLEGAVVSIHGDQNWQPVRPDDPLPMPVEILAKGLVPKQAIGIICPPYWFNEFTTLTDQNGQYSLNVPSGYLNISVWAEGYDGAYEQITLHPREAITRDFRLTKWQEELPPPDGGGGEQR